MSQSRWDELLPVEPLADERVDDVERRVLAQFPPEPATLPARRLAPLAWTAIPVVAIAGILLWVALGGQGATAPGALVTAGRSPAVVDLGDARVELLTNSAAIVSGGRVGSGGASDSLEPVVIELQRGQVHCDVDPRDRRRGFRVVAGDVRVDVVGTVFDVVRRGEAIGVSVERGQVRVTRAGGESVAVRAGQSWGSLLMAATEPEAASEAEPQDESKPDSDTDSEPEPGSKPAAESESEPGSDADAEAEAVRLAAGRRTARRAGARLGSRVDTSDGPGRGRRAGKTGRGGEGVAKKRGAGSSGPRRALVEPPRHAAPRSPLLEPALAAERAGNSAEALAAFGRVLSARGQVAEYALYSLAYLELARGRHRRAERNATAFLRRFPRSSYAADAAWLRLVSLSRAGADANARAAAFDFVRKYPRDPRAAAARFVADGK